MNVTVHREDNGRGLTACGATPGPEVATTTVARLVTCKRCRKTILFLRARSRPAPEVRE